MPGLSLFLQHLELALRLTATYPALDMEVAYEHAEAAAMAATDDIKAELLLAVAFVESRFDLYWVSRVEGTERRIGRHPSDRPPARWRRGTNLFCGPLQTMARTWDQCLSHRELRVAYETGAKEIDAWLKDRRVRGDLTRALSGYGCGNHGVRTGKCNRYPGRVLYQARRLAAPNVHAGS